MPEDARCDYRPMARLGPPESRVNGATCHTGAEDGLADNLSVIRRAAEPAPNVVVRFRVPAVVKGERLLSGASRRGNRVLVASPQQREQHRPHRQSRMRPPRQAEGSVGSYGGLHPASCLRLGRARGDEGATMRRPQGAPARSPECLPRPRPDLRRVPIAYLRRQTTRFLEVK